MGEGVITEFLAVSVTICPYINRSRGDELQLYFRSNSLSRHLAHSRVNVWFAVGCSSLTALESKR